MPMQERSARGQESLRESRDDADLNYRVILLPIDFSEHSKRYWAASRFVNDASYVARKTEAKRILRSGWSSRNGSSPHHPSGHPIVNEASPSWISRISSGTGCQFISFATFVRTSRSTPDTKI